jgi:predicted transcriptional regulator
MPMGVVTDADFEKELDNSGKEPIVPEIVEMERPGRKEGDNNVPSSLRKIIAETANIEGRSTALQFAAELGISPSSVSAYTNGATSTSSYHEPKKDILNHVRARREKVTSKAHAKLISALSAITTDKLRDIKAPDLAGIAKDMSVIIKNMEPPETLIDEKKDTPQFVIFAPQFSRIITICPIVLCPALAFAQNQADANDRIGWTQVAGSLAEANSFTYKYYPDSNPVGVTLSGVTCAGTVSPFACEVLIPVFTPGPHTIELTASNATGESPKSIPLAFDFVAAPARPANLVIIRK